MYAGVPSAMLATLASESSSFFVPAKDFTSPKSSTFTKSCRRPTRPRWMLAGLMSRCTSPASWLPRATSQIWRRMWTTRARERAVRCTSRVEIDPLQQLHHQIEPASCVTPKS